MAHLASQEYQQGNPGIDKISRAFNVLIPPLAIPSLLLSLRAFRLASPPEKNMGCELRSLHELISGC